MMGYRSLCEEVSLRRTETGSKGWHTSCSMTLHLAGTSVMHPVDKIYSPHSLPRLLPMSKDLETQL